MYTIVYNHVYVCMYHVYKHLYLCIHRYTRETDTHILLTHNRPDANNNNKNLAMRLKTKRLKAKRPETQKRAGLS